MEVALQHLAAGAVFEGAPPPELARPSAGVPSSGAEWVRFSNPQVTITLTGKDGATKLDLVQTGVPEDEKERTEKGWNGLLFDRLKAMLGGSVAR